MASSPLEFAKEEINWCFDIVVECYEECINIYKKFFLYNDSKCVSQRKCEYGRTFGITMFDLDD
jgi:hypothetical protein